MKGPLWDTVPAGWMTGQVKNVATVTLGKMLQSKDSGDDLRAPYMRAANVQPDGVLALEDVNEMWFGEEELRQLDIRSGDVVVVEGGQGGFGRAAYVGEDLSGWGFQNSINRLRSRDGVDGRFIAYYLIALRSSGFIRAYANVVSMPHLTAEKLARIPMPLPPLGTQRSIANYLDRETTRIDTLIEEQLCLIETLRERRVATVTDALEGYGSTRLRRLVDPARPMTYGILQCGEPVDEGIRYIGPSDIVGEGESPRKEALRTTTPQIADAYQRSVLAGGDVVVSIGPAYGKVAVVADDLAGANLTQDTVRVALRPDLADTRFVVWALLSRQTAEYWDYEIMGATFRRLNLGTLARTPIPLVSLDEQRRIAVYLDEHTAKIDTLIMETERFIELSKERRAALITAAVTGQIDLCGVA